MAMRIQTLHVREVRAVQIVDSHGLPALEVRVTLADGATGAACVPADAPVPGGPDALLDAATIDTAILDAAAVELRDTVFDGLADLDGALGKIADGAFRPRPGPSVLRGVSMAAARALAARRRMPLWRLLALPEVEQRLPIPQFTLINGGNRARTALDFEEFMVVPLGAPSVHAAVRTGCDLRARLRTVLADSALADDTLADNTLGGEVGRDGGFAPAIEWPERALELISRAIADAGYALGPEGVVLAVRAAAGGFRYGDWYRVAGERLSTSELIARYEQMVADFPLWSIEDALAADDWHGWTDMTRRLGDKVQLVGGDVFTTGSDVVPAAVAGDVANAALIRPGGFGTVTEALDAVRACREAGYGQVVVHRGGTSDTFAADLAVAAGCGQLRAGAATCGQRVASYNRLIQIEADDRLPYRG